MNERHKDGKVEGKSPPQLEKRKRKRIMTIEIKISKAKDAGKEQIQKNFERIIEVVPCASHFASPLSAFLHYAAVFDV